MRVAFSFALVGGIGFLVAAWMTSTVLLRVSQEGAEERLRATLQSRIVELSNYLQSVSDDVLLLTSARGPQDAMVVLPGAFRALGPDPAAEVARLYVDENPFPASERYKLTHAKDNSEYSRLHAYFHRALVQMMTARDFYDVFLVGPDDNIVYTVFKERDIGTNLNTGALRGTVLADLSTTLKTAAPGTITMTDFVRYGPSGGIQAAFAGAPFYRDGEFIGSLIVQMRIDKFNEVMTAQGGLGKTGETFLVGIDGLMRTNSRFDAKAALSRSVKNTAVDRAFRLLSGTERIVDPDGRVKQAVYMPFEWPGGVWAAVAQMDAVEIRTVTSETRLRLLLVGVLFVMVAGFAGWGLANPHDGQ